MQEVVQQGIKRLTEVFPEYKGMASIYEVETNNFFVVVKNKKGIITAGCMVTAEDYGYEFMIIEGQDAKAKFADLKAKFDKYKAKVDAEQAEVQKRIEAAKQAEEDRIAQENAKAKAEIDNKPKKSAKKETKKVDV